MTARTKRHTSFSQASLVRAYQRMYLIRIAEEKIAELYRTHKIMSFVHFYIGQEAVAVGVCDALTSADKAMGNHRSHGHYLAKGGDLTAMICELLGKEKGLARGKGGSMHMIDRSANFVGSTPILGSIVPLSSGVAFEQKYHKKKGVTVAFFGDGASEEGVVYETLNLAGLFKLPLLLVIENNLYSVNSLLRDRRAAGYDVETIVKGLGARYLQANGLDYRDVRAKAEELVSYLRAGSGPAVLECMTYRHMAHSAPIFDESVRTEDVLEKRQEQDSIRRLRNELVRGGISEKKIASIERACAARVDASIGIALNAPYPKKNSLSAGLYV